MKPDELTRHTRELMVEITIARAHCRLLRKERNFTELSRIEKMIAALEFRAELLLEQAKAIETRTSEDT